LRYLLFVIHYWASHSSKVPMAATGRCHFAATPTVCTRSVAAAEDKPLRAAAARAKEQRKPTAALRDKRYCRAHSAGSPLVEASVQPTYGLCVSRAKLTLLNGAVRLGYGLYVTAWPSRSAGTALPLAPDTDAFPEARLFVRGFSAHQIGVALVSVASLRRRDLAASALALAMSRPMLVGDGIQTSSGGAIFSGVGLAPAVAAWLAE
jgi:hypothetical protein